MHLTSGWGTGHPEIQHMPHLSREERQSLHGKGSMEPKVSAVLNFLGCGGKKAIITNPENMLRALGSETGTHFEA